MYRVEYSNIAIVTTNMYSSSVCNTSSYKHVFRTKVKMSRHLETVNFGTHLIHAHPDT